MTRLIARLRRARRDSRGLSLVEVLVAAGITMVVLTLVTTAVIGGFRLHSATDAETSGQFDVRTTIERLGRDVRNARSIDAGATGSRLVLWIDSDSDYTKDASEVVTWELIGPVNGQFDVRRSVQGGAARTQSNLVVAQLAFSYRSLANGTALTVPLSAADAKVARIVNGSIQYDATVGSGTGTRVTTFTERLRNVE